MIGRWLMTVCIALGGLFGCTRPPEGELRTVRMQIGDEWFTLEVADTEDAQAYGLMNRHSMPRDHGMIFVFDEEARRGFWMKDTFIDLDLIYLSSEGRVMSIHRLEAESDRLVRSAGPVRYAIELNRGATDRIGLNPGDVIQIPREVHEAPPPPPADPADPADKDQQPDPAPADPAEPAQSPRQDPAE